ncbi:hypothetical protein HCUR_00411 [Holospora curviuscula]|uniref:Uncharacterized protein n=1 Tax=Holospora curviuscula TaxID=1082868 RepID=A0A2S5RA95_9PROT|nr:hypothetical protein HCUR_00411 [Holospora curviuscula]
MPDRIWSLLEPRLPGRKGSWGGIAHNIGFLSTPPFGYCALAHPGEIYLLSMATEKTRIDAFADGGTKAFGKGC